MVQISREDISWMESHEGKTIAHYIEDGKAKSILVHMPIENAAAEAGLYSLVDDSTGRGFAINFAKVAEIKPLPEDEEIEISILFREGADRTTGKVTLCTLHDFPPGPGTVVVFKDHFVVVFPTDEESMTHLQRLHMDHHWQDAVDVKARPN